LHWYGTDKEQPGDRTHKNTKITQHKKSPYLTANIPTQKKPRLRNRTD